MATLKLKLPTWQQIQFTRELRLLTLVSVLVVGLGVFRMATQERPKPGKPDVSAQVAFMTANQFAQGKNADMTPYLSAAYRAQCDRVVGLLPVAARIATRAGTITEVKTHEKTFISSDSALVKMEVIYKDGMKRKFDQAMVYENGWKVGLVFTKGDGGF